MSNVDLDQMRRDLDEVLQYVRERKLQQISFPLDEASKRIIESI